MSSKVGNFLRPRQITELEQDRRDLNAAKANPLIQDKATVAKQLKAVEGMLESGTPPDLSPQQRDNVSKKIKELEADIRVGMPSAQEMRRMPAGAIDRHQAWEKRNKNNILFWKDLQLSLHKGDQGPNLANIERLRPMQTVEGRQDGNFIEPKSFSFPSEEFTSRYDDVFGKADEERHPIFDLQDEKAAVEVEELREQTRKLLAEVRSLREAKPAKKKTRASPNLSDEERKRRSDVMKAMKARQRAEKESSEVADTLPAAPSSAPPGGA